MRDRWERTDRRVDLVVVTFASPRASGGYGRRFDLRVPILSDPDRLWYRALGFPRGSTATVFRWRTIREYGRLVARGRMPERPTDDLHQLGGDAVIDGEGRIAWLYRSVAPDDRPAADDVVDAALAASG